MYSMLLMFSDRHSVRQIATYCVADLHAAWQIDMLRGRSICCVADRHAACVADAKSVLYRGGGKLLWCAVFMLVVPRYMRL